MISANITELTRFGTEHLNDSAGNFFRMVYQQLAVV